MLSSSKRPVSDFVLTRVKRSLRKMAIECQAFQPQSLGTISVRLPGCITTTSSRRTTSLTPRDSRVIDLTPSYDINDILDVRLVMVGLETGIRSALSAEVAGRLQLQFATKSLPRR